MPNHNCTLLDRDECETCEAYFWEKKARHDDDYAGLESFLEMRAEALKDEYTRQGIRQLA